jgi:galactokinase
MALHRAILVTLRPREDELVRLQNLDARFPPREFEISGSIVPFAGGDWANYAKAAAQALAQRYPIRRGFDGLVHGDVPDAAGLASSSALLVACVLAILASNEIEPDRIELMDLCARAERYVGTHSGGMDQAICFGALPGNAALIEFDPLRLKQTPIPADWRFVVANTFVEAKKSGAAREAYNTRVAECREALGLVERGLGEKAGDPRVKNFGDLLVRTPAGRVLELAADLPERLHRRVRHVVTEAGRVEDARAAMLDGDLEGFGRAMDASHASLRDDYEVSTKELDALVEVAKEHGAAGARLTGAGFGGCAVAVCRAPRLAGLLEGLERAGRKPRADSPVAFVATAASGADVVSI